MKILHFGTLDVKAGGPAMSTYNTLYGLNQIGIEADIIMYPPSSTGKLIGENVVIHYAKAPIDHKFAYSPTLKKEIKKLGIYDIYHAQGIWQYPTYAIVDVAKSLNRPYVITPRGMLYPQDIKKSNKVFKILSLKYRLLNDLNNAACVQVTCKEEMEHCRNLGVTSPIAIIPNPIKIKNYTERKKDNIFRLGYLGRLSPRKNVESLIYAFHELGSLTNNAELLIIGGGDKNYEEFLKSEAKRLNLKNIKFAGFLSGKEKDEALSSLSVLAMPSEFENLGNVILEALVRKIPCIATKGSPWKELNEYKCGWWVEYSQAQINEAIKEALQTTNDQLLEMGERGYNLIKENYSIEAISIKMKSLYNWILNKKQKEPFISIYNE